MEKKTIRHKNCFVYCGPDKCDCQKEEKKYIEEWIKNSYDIKTIKEWEKQYLNHWNIDFTKDVN